MTDTPTLTFIGTVEITENRYEIQLNPTYRSGLLGLSDFGHAHVLWWANQAATATDRSRLVCARPYARSDADVGVFASRSPERPNPIGMSVVTLMQVDADKGRIIVPFIDALPGTPVLDIKPYFPTSDRVRDVRMPEWSEPWPMDYESSADFDWSGEFR